MSTKVFSPSSAYIDRGCCGGLHAVENDGSIDCRADEHRFTYEELDAHHGEDGYTVTDQEEQDEEETPVLFRKYPKTRVRDPWGVWSWEDGDVIAIFPAEPGDMNSYTCSSYMHVGQHGSCDPHSVVQSTRKAKPEEYAALKQELESAPYGYRLKIYSRLQRNFLDIRRKKLKD